MEPSGGVAEDVPQPLALDRAVTRAEHRRAEIAQGTQRRRGLARAGAGVVVGLEAVRLVDPAPRVERVAAAQPGACRAVDPKSDLMVDVARRLEHLEVVRAPDD